MRVRKGPDSVEDFSIEAPSTKRHAFYVGTAESEEPFRLKVREEPHKYMACRIEIAGVGETQAQDGAFGRVRGDVQDEENTQTAIH